MGTNGTHTHWGMVINNYTETDLALVQQGYPDHIRQIVYTREVGAEGTPHIQAFIKMKRDCRLTHMKKLFPRANFKYLDSSEYRLNAQRYAQKLDATSRGFATITNGDPLHTLEGVVRVVITKMINDYEEEVEMSRARRYAEHDLIMEDYSYAKIFVGATYKAMWKEWGTTMYESIVHTHTHTHTAEKSYVDVGTQTDGHSQLLQSQADDGSDRTSSQGSCTEGDSEADCSSGSEESDCPNE